MAVAMMPIPPPIAAAPATAVARPLPHQPRQHGGPVVVSPATASNTACENAAVQPSWRTKTSGSAAKPATAAQAIGVSRKDWRSVNGPVSAPRVARRSPSPASGGAWPRSRAKAPPSRPPVAQFGHRRQQHQPGQRQQHPGDQRQHRPHSPGATECRCAPAPAPLLPGPSCLRLRRDQGFRLAQRRGGDGGDDAIAGLDARLAIAAGSPRPGGRSPRWRSPREVRAPREGRRRGGSRAAPRPPALRRNPRAGCTPPPPAPRRMCRRMEEMVMFAGLTMASMPRLGRIGS